MTIGTTNYPGSLDTVNELIQAVNRASSPLGSTIDADDDEITVDDSTLAPGSGVIWIDAEAISFTGKLGNTLTGCVRGFDNTTPAPHTNGTTVYFDIISAAYHNTLASTIIAIETFLGADGGNIIRRDLDTNQTMIGPLTIETANPTTIRTTTSTPLILERYVASSNGASFIGRKSRHATLNSHTIVVDGDVLSQWEAHGSDGSGFVQAARIRQRVNGTPASGIIPSKIDFETMTTAGVLTTRMTIFNNGKIQMFSDINPALEIFNVADTNLRLYLNQQSTGYAELATDNWGIGEDTDGQSDKFYLWNYNASQLIFGVDKTTSKTTFSRALAVSCDDDPQLDIVGLTGHARIRLIRGDSGYDASVTTHDWDFGENGSEEFYIWDSVNSRYALRINQSSGLITLRGPAVWIGDGSASSHELAINSPNGLASYISFRNDGASIWEMGKDSTDDFFISDPQTGLILTIDYTTGVTSIWGGLDAYGLTAADLADTTKLLAFDVSTVPTGTTITISAPEVSGQLALRGAGTYVSADRALLNNNLAQDIFGSSGNSVNLSASHWYQFEGLIKLSRAAGTNAHTIQLLFAGTATFSRFRYTAISNVTAGGAPNMFFGTVVSSTSVTVSNNSSTENNTIWVRGFAICNGSGTFVPQLQYSASPGGVPTVAEGTFFNIWPVASTGNAIFGGFG